MVGWQPDPWTGEEPALCKRPPAAARHGPKSLTSADVSSRLCSSGQAMSQQSHLNGVVHFGQVELDLSAQALHLVRHRVITRQWPLDRALDVHRLSDDLELPQQIVYQALLTLVAEGLLTSRGSGELVVTAVDRRLVDHSFRARVAIELGVAELTVSRVSGSELRELRDRAWATAALVAGGQVADVDAYIDTDAAFHEYLVRLAGSDALVVAYRRSSLPTLMAILSEGPARTDADRRGRIRTDADRRAQDAACRAVAGFRIRTRWPAMDPPSH